MMTNGLVNAIQEQIDPFYPAAREVIAKNIIYLHQFWAQKKLYELIPDEYPLSAFVGQTAPERVDPKLGLLRFGDGDYSKCPEGVEIAHYDYVHEDLSDHYVRNHLFSKGCRKNSRGGSPEMVEAPEYIKSYSEFIDFIVKEIKFLNKQFYDLEEKYGFTPESHAKKIKEKDLEAMRAPKLHLVQSMTDRLINVNKDAMIYVPKDAWGYFCKFLSGLGYTNIYTDKDYDMRFGLDSFPNPDVIHLITQEEYSNMDFDGIIGNPPFGKGGNLALNFLNNSANRVRQKNGFILYILPKSIKKGSANFNKIDRSLELVDSKDCDPKDFSSSIDACIQEWRIGETLRPIEKQYKEHPHIEFLKYEHRFDADIFVGGDGEGSCGKVHLPSWIGKDGKGFTKYEKSSSHNYIKVRPDDDITKEEIIRRIVSLGHEGDNTFTSIGKGTTNGIPHLGKTKLITAYVNRYGTGH